MKIGIIGVGFVGGATYQVLKTKHQVFPYDKYKKPYNTAEKLTALARESDVVFICVPTPMKPSGEIDYSAIHNSLTALEEAVKLAGRKPQEILVTIRSTAVSGTTDKLAKRYPFRFAFNPEFLREKTALKDTKNTDRIVIGTADAKSKKQLTAVYKPIFPKAKYIFVNRQTAEMVKYAANVMLASQISLANEIYNICQAVKVDYETVKNIILLDSRIGRNITVPGWDGDFGFGGKCFPKDLNALIYLAREQGYPPHLLEEVWRLNQRVRKNQDWLDIPGATSGNQNFSN